MSKKSKKTFISSGFKFVQLSFQGKKQQNKLRSLSEEGRELNFLSFFF